MVVNAEAQSSIRLFGKENRRVKRGLARLNKALIKVVNKVLLYGLQFSDRLQVERAKAKGASLALINLDLIVIWLVRRKYIQRYLGEYVLEFLVLIGQFLFY